MCKTVGDALDQCDIDVRVADGTYQTYRTKQLLSDAGGVYLQGRGTRVWTAVRLENGSETGELVALKDSWVDEYREREGSLNHRIRRAAVLQEDRDKLDDSIVRVALYGDVYVAGVPDCTRMVPDSECMIALVLQSLSAIRSRDTSSGRLPEETALHGSSDTHAHSVQGRGPSH